MVYYSTRMAVVFDKRAKQAGLGGQIIRAKPREEVADRK